jgi:hypothetical protein
VNHIKITPTVAYTQKDYKANCLAAIDIANETTLVIVVANKLVPELKKVILNLSSSDLLKSC